MLQDAKDDLVRARDAEDVSSRETIQLRMTVNGEAVKVDVPAERSLLDVLRGSCGLTGAKNGCDIGICGTCTVLVDGKAVLACQTPVKDVRGAKIVTIEGLIQNGNLHPIQQAFIDHDALQCGFCTPGMILKAYDFLDENPKPTEDDIISAMDDNLCRCGSHIRIVRAVQTAAKHMQEGKQG